MKGSRLALRLPRNKVAQLRAMARLAGVTVSQLVSVIIVLEVQRLRIAEKKRDR